MENLDIYSLVKGLFDPVVAFITGLFLNVLALVLAALLLFFAVFFLLCRVNPLHPDLSRLQSMKLTFLPYDFLRWFWFDFLSRKSRKSYFKPFGFTIFVGRQGSGKTISMVRFLDSMKRRYPECLVVTNFQYAGADRQMSSWRDFFEVRNEGKGVIFALDEIHSEYSASEWKDFPEILLSEISQQRKQRVKIVATAQVFNRVCKPIREQAFSVVCCSTYFGRLTFNREYDASEYVTGDTPYMVRKKCKPIWRSVFVQSNMLRESYDTYEKIQRLKRADFIPRHERGAS